MRHSAHLRSRSGILLALALSMGCSILGDRSQPERPKAKIESLFVEPDHRLGTCLHGDLAQSYTSDPDSVLFFDKDSKIRVTPPTKKGAVAYHAHVLHRVENSDILDFNFAQGSDGRIEIDLGRFDQPEEVVITSAARRVTEDRPRAEDGSAILERPEEFITPPYVVSFRLVPRAGQIEHILPLNRHRYEIATETGTLFLMVSSFSKRDQLLTLLDPERALGPLMAEDPYVYLQGEDGAVPPRIVVEVLRPDSKQPWQKAATYHIPEAADRFTSPSDRPFVLRTSRRDLIAFAPAPRLDLEFPKEPAQTSAVVKASFKGVADGDALKVILACAYPSGSNGDYATRVQSHVVTSATGSETYACDLGHLDPASFPLVATLVNRFITPWKLTAGRWAPEPPMGKVSVPLAAPAGDAVKYSKLLAPRYASHFDVLAFLGAGSGKRRGSSILDSDFGGQPDDPNVTPPPVPPVGGGGPGGGGIVSPPTPAPIPPPQNAPQGQNLGGGVAGGPDSYCGCGKDGAGCQAQPKCKGHCGKQCPANGCCPPAPNRNGGDILIKFPCPPKGRTCGQSEADCKCGQHQWDKDSVRAAVLALLQGTPNFADLDGPSNKPIGFAPCHKKTYIDDVVAHFWNPNAVMGIGGRGPQQYLVTYRVHVIFSPCIPIPGGGGGMGKVDPGVPGTPNQDPGQGDGTLFAANLGNNPTSPLTGATFTIDVDDPSFPISTSGNVTIDPNTSIDVSTATTALNGGTGGATNVIFADILRTDVQTLAGIRSAAIARANARTAAWLVRPINVLNGPDTWTMTLPSSQWAKYVQQTTSTSGGTTTPPPSTPPPPGPTTSTKPGPRS